MSDIILFVFEGEKTEPDIFDNFKKYFLKDNSIEYAIYQNNIYHLYKELHNDEDLELIKILKKRNINDSAFQKIENDNISEIYLFFDYEG